MFTARPAARDGFGRWEHEVIPGGDVVAGLLLNFILGLLRDLQDLYLLATLVDTTWTVVYQAAQGARDRELIEICQSCQAETSRQLKWIQTRMKVSAPQVLLVAQ